MENSFNQISKVSKSISPEPPPLHPPSSSSLKEVQPEIDNEGFQLVKNRRYRGKTFHQQSPAKNLSKNLANLSSNGNRNTRFSNSKSIVNQYSHAAPNYSTTVQKKQDSSGTNSLQYNSKGSSSNKASSWADLIREGGLRPDFDLKYQAPLTINKKKMVVMKEGVSKRTETKWGCSVIAYVYGNRPSYHHFKAFVQRTWNPVSNFEIFSRNNGFFVIKFTAECDCEKAINGGPYFINGKLIILKKWSSKIAFDRDLLSTIPVWIRLPELSLKLWDKEAFGLYQV